MSGKHSVRCSSAQCTNKKFVRTVDQWDLVRVQLFSLTTFRNGGSLGRKMCSGWLVRSPVTDCEVEGIALGVTMALKYYGQCVQRNSVGDICVL